ncbi:hypothetical protein [Nannocystis punicea]|uniref:Uncharacterized protein n=1 Tax=Nannocystis punicea TaxID=2995304 RepID=A0ABY7H653_9BACT|nr:hypothetical protein [Nannocystis poenicansa]WAS94754.1 hypothetical protein O0S08_01225 [Nannocystis poenicansa]
MLRKILMLCPALAFALPFIAATPSMARPLSIPVEASEWGGQDFGDDVLLAVCTQTQILVQTGFDDDRAYECDTLAGPSCLATCDNVAGEAVQTCRSQCDGQGAMFCTPSDLKARWGGGLLGGGLGGGWDDGWDDGWDQGFDDNALFIDTSTCLELNVNEI